MRERIVEWMAFLCIAAAILIMLKLHWNMGVFVDEFNTSPDRVLGGECWMYMDWLKTGLVLVAGGLVGGRLLVRNK